MREIKCRAWDSDKSRMIYPTERQSITSCCTVIEVLSNYQLSTGYYKTKITYSCNGYLMLFSGVQDIKGIDIYEDDILRDMYGNIGLCKFENTEFIFINTSGCITNYSVIRNGWEKIGNKYENPELLEKVT